MESAKPKAQLKRLLSLARPELPRLSVATIALLISAVTGLLYPQVIRFMVDALATGNTPFSLNTGAIFLVIIFVLQSTFATLRAWLFTAAGESIVAKLRLRVFKAIVGQDIEFFDHRRTGELTNRLTVDTTVLQNTVTANVSLALRYSLVGGTLREVVEEFFDSV